MADEKITETPRSNLNTPLIGTNENAVGRWANGDTMFGLLLETTSRITRTLKVADDSLNGINKNLENLLMIYAKTNAAASKYAKTLGLSGEAMDGYGKRIQQTVADLDLGRKFGISGEKLIEIETQYNEELGRRVGINNEGYVATSSMSSLGMETADIAQLSSGLENLGISLEETGEFTAKMFKDANKAGVSFSKLSKKVSENMAMASKYGFKDGVKSLENMVKRSMELGMNMEVAANFASKIMEEGVGGAIEAGAKLQVLGGDFARLANPLSMLNEGLNDTEALQERIAKMYSQMAHFNEQTGQIEINSADRLRMTSAAKAIGSSYDELYKTANRQAISTKIERDISNAGGLGMNEDLVNLLKNTGVINKGKSGANINGEFHTVGEIAKDVNLQQQLKEQQIAEENGDSKNIADIALSVRSIKDKLDYTAVGWENKAGKDIVRSPIFGMDISDFIDQGVDIMNSEQVGEVGGFTKFSSNLLGELISNDKSLLDNALRLITQSEDRDGWHNWGLDPDGTFDKLGTVIREALPNWLYDSNIKMPEFHANGGYAGGNINGGIKGPSHNAGGVNIEAEGGEYIVNKNAMRNPLYAGIVETINESTNNGPSKYSNGGRVNPDGINRLIKNVYGDSTTIKYANGGNILSNMVSNHYGNPFGGIENIGGGFTFIRGLVNTEIAKVFGNISNSGFGGQNQNRTNTDGKIDVNVHGSIRLDAPDGRKFDISSLLKDPVFIREISKVISDSMSSKSGIYNSLSI